MEIVPIVIGCNHQCSFCSYLEHPAVSINPKEIFSKIKKTVNRGEKTILLGGVNPTDYDYQGLKLSDLIKAILIMPIAEKIDEIRVSVFDPGSTETEKCVELIAEHKKLKSVRLAMQSGSNRMLTLMKRRHTKTRFLDVFYKVIKCTSNVAIDVLVGFIDETDDDFEQTLNMLRYCKMLNEKLVVYCYEFNNFRVNLPNELPKQVVLDRIKLVEALELEELKLDMIQPENRSVSPQGLLTEIDYQKLQCDVNDIDKVHIKFTTREEVKEFVDKCLDMMAIHRLGEIHINVEMK